jgi:ribonuclease Z
MRRSFQPRLVNGPLFDPVLYIRVLNSGRALMMDCGHFRGISNRELVALEAVCVSHTHMDHFMGFDQVLRTILHRDEPLDIYGPEGIIEKTAAKLKAYTWNLTRGYNLELRIHEVGEGGITRTRLRADEGFVLHECGKLPREGAAVALYPRYRLDAAILDHRGIPCLAYVVREPFHVGIRRGAPERRGFLPGPWMAELKERILAGRLEGSIRVETRTGGEDIPVRDLRDSLTIETPGHSVAYVTDIACTESNMEALACVAQGVDILFIEAFYLDELRGPAREKGHLTAAQAGLIARSLGVNRLFPMHVSPRYHGSLEPFLLEMGVRPDGTLIDPGARAKEPT